MLEAKRETENNNKMTSIHYEAEYVVVTSSPNDEPLELPTNTDDNTLGMSTLVHAFPGAHGLKYKNPKTGASRALLYVSSPDFEVIAQFSIDTSGTKFCAPAGGWTDKVFTVIYSTEPPKRLMAGEQNPKRKKMMDDAVSSDSEDGDRNVHGAQVAKLLRLNKEDEDVSVVEKDSKNEKLSSESGCSDLLVLGLPYKLEEHELKLYFEKFGQVEFVEVKKLPSGESKGFGFIRMANLAEQNAVLDSPSHSIGGRKCHVKFPLSKSSDARDGRSPENVRLFVGRLSDKITPKRLREFFTAEAHKIDAKARVTDAFIPNPFRGFAFINLSNPVVAKELLKKDNFVIDDNAVALSIAAPKAQQQQFTPYNMAGPSSHMYDRRGGGATGYYGRKPEMFHYPDVWDNCYQGQYFGDAYEHSYPGNSQSISTGLETLNLNMKPDAMNEALKAFWNAARSNPPHSSMERGPPNFHPSSHPRAPAYPRRDHPASSPSGYRWR